MIYDITWRNQQQFIDDCIKNNKILWACAYKVNNETLHVDLHKLPVKGVIGASPKHKWSNYAFLELKKDGTPKTSGAVEISSRIYADTYLECLQAYNREVQKRKYKLLKLAAECDNDFLTIPKDNQNYVLNEYLDTYVNKNLITPKTRVYCHQDIHGQYVDLDYDYDDNSLTTNGYLSVFAELYEDGNPTDDTWADAVATAHFVGQKYQIPVVIEEE